MSEHRLRFRPTDRIRRQADFDRVYHHKYYAADPYLVVQGCANELSHSRLGLSVSRRVGNAVLRNRWKRIIREAFRTLRHELPVGLDLVVRPRRGAARVGRGGPVLAASGPPGPTPDAEDFLMVRLRRMATAALSWLLILGVRAYQVTLSPLLGGSCRFTPSCSVYFVEAVRKYGPCRGAWRGLCRIAKCHPFHPGGQDWP